MYFSVSLELYLFIYYWLCWVFTAVHRLSLVTPSRGYSSLQCAGFSLQWRLLLWMTGSRCPGFSHCSTQAQELGSQALEYVGFSSWGMWAYFLQGMWNPTGAGIKPVSPVLAGKYPLRHQGSPKLTLLTLFYKSANSNKFPLLGSKITVDGDCSHEIRRQLLLGRKTMTNLDSVLKSRGITLPTKVRIVKVMVFPVVTYGCESWTTKKEVVVHIYNGILLSHKKECIWVTSDEVDEPRAYYTQWSESERER